MKNRKILFYYFMEFIYSILVFSTIILTIFKLTILNHNYLIQKLNETNYYHELYLDIYNDLENYIRQSGFDKTVISDIINQDTLKKVINNNVDNFYKGLEIIVDTKEIETKLNDNINNYINTKKIIIDDSEAIRLFKDEIIKIYKDRIVISNYLLSYSSKFNNLINLITKILLINLIIDIIMFIFIKKIFNKVTLTIPIISSLLLLILTYYLLFSKININYIVFWNSYISEVIKIIFKDLVKTTKIIIICGFGYEIIKIMYILKKNR